jgi:hypothetical protein
MPSTSPSNAVQEFARLRDSIYAEREQLLTRLRAIDEALGSMGFAGRESYYGPRPTGSRARNELSLKEAVLQVIKGKAMTKQEILDAVLATGYQFTTDDPLNSLGVVLYGRNPELKRDGKRFLL